MQGLFNRISVLSCQTSLSFLPSDDILKMSKIKTDQVKSYNNEQTKCESYQCNTFESQYHQMERAQITSKRTHKTQQRKCSLYSVILKLLQGIHPEYQGRGGGNKPNKQCLSLSKSVT